jgi:hypothetical protein
MRASFRDSNQMNNAKFSTVLTTNLGFPNDIDLLHWVEEPYTNSTTLHGFSCHARPLFKHCSDIAAVKVHKRRLTSDRADFEATVVFHF